MKPPAHTDPGAADGEPRAGGGIEERERGRLKDRVRAARGYWAPFHDILLQRAPGFLEAYVEFQAGPAIGGIIAPRLCELIYVAIDVSVNHMYPSGGRRHMELALKAGATPEEVLQTILIATALAARQPLELGLSILADETADQAPAADVPDADHACHAYDAAAREAGPLSAKEREFIALAVCAAPDSLFTPGIRRHIRAAIAAGATRREIATVLQLAAAISIHTCTIALPALEDAIASAKG